MPEVVRRLPERQWNLPDLQAYIEAGRATTFQVLETEAPADSITDSFSSVREGETLDEEQLALERLMLGLRTSAGLTESFLRAHCDPEALSNALDSGHLVPSDPALGACDVAAKGSYLRIPERHFFISDAIIADLA